MNTAIMIKYDDLKMHLTEIALLLLLLLLLLLAMALQLFRLALASYSLS
jgi:hypothetical protein